MHAFLVAQQAIRELVIGNTKTQANNHIDLY